MLIDNETSASYSVKLLYTVNFIYRHQCEVFPFYEVFKYRGTKYTLPWLPPITQKQISDSSIATFMSY